MNDYPAYDQLLSSSMKVLDDVTIDRSTSGAARGRSFYPATKHSFSAVHLLDDTDLADLMQFYEDNRGELVSFTWLKTGDTFTCFMAGPPVQSFPDAAFTQVTVALEEQ